MSNWGKRERERERETLLGEKEEASSLIRALLWHNFKKGEAGRTSQLKIQSCQILDLKIGRTT